MLEAHKNQVDKGGMPYVFHPIHIAEHIGGYDNNLVVTALLYDVVEDSDYTLNDLREMGFDESVIEAIDILTRKDDENYFDYIARIKKNKIARAVKIADLRHNSDIGRIDDCKGADYERLEKYAKALDILDHRGQFTRGDIEMRKKKSERLFGDGGDYDNEKIDMRELYFLDMVRDCPALYLRKKNLTALSHELSGIRTGISICEHIKNSI